MSIEDNVKAAAKEMEGRLQAAAGAVSGDPGMEAAGQAKQIQAKVMHAAADIKDKAQDVIAKLSGE